MFTDENLTSTKLPQLCSNDPNFSCQQPSFVFLGQQKKRLEQINKRTEAKNHLRKLLYQPKTVMSPLHASHITIFLPFGRYTLNTNDYKSKFMIMIAPNPQLLSG
jgi:hypothetical protein